MEFTGLHRALGAQPSPLTSELIDEAVRAGLKESDNLDWKSDLPPAKDIAKTDFPKDVAAMANAGGGVIVYGIAEEQKAATQRLDVGTLSEAHERALRSAAVTAISPPVFGLDVVRLGEDGGRVVVVVVPDSLDGPHLIYKGEYFGAPIRNDADTVWMRERQVEQMYQARFDERRYAHEALDTLYDEMATGRDTTERAWFVGVARPRVPIVGAPRIEREYARSLAEKGGILALVYAGRGGIHPLENVDRLNPRPGLRRWILANSATTERTLWKEAWSSIHDDGAATVASAVGGHRTSDGETSGDAVDTSAIECAIADLLALVHETADDLGTRDYEVRIGIEWAGAGPLTFYTRSQYGINETATLPRYTTIRTSIRPDVDPAEFADIVYDLATDAVNQAGVRAPSLMSRSVSD
ncbi:ATP-binding protein [Nocardioides immobilis]|uniref:ATP-binding protein n=1 Tax=Nocardioides immobilis TaxID=2049295 RepID=A0A417XTT8_9ACTN|nr:ATP-binding protein [Nocardioides immobilis]RHW23715.1 ATP-binding protein [Nocardioides immobilis]